MLDSFFRKKLYREDFLKIVPKNSVCAEIGVFRGQFSKQILLKTKPKEFHLIDLWFKLGEFFPWKAEDTNWGKLKTRDAYEETKGVIERYDKKKVSIIHVEDVLVFLKKFPDYYFDWVYLDTWHTYEQTKKELESLKDKIKIGGLITGHDWQPNPNHPHHGVFKAVNEFCEKYGWKIIKLDDFLQWALKRIKDI